MQTIPEPVTSLLAHDPSSLVYRTEMILSSCLEHSLLDLYIAAPSCCLLPLQSLWLHEVVCSLVDESVAGGCSTWTCLPVPHVSLTV